MRGATRDGNRLLTALRISIHAPHARSDLNSFSLPQSHWQNFNPRSSCEERRHLAAIRLELIVFQSTLLMRGATATLLVAALALAKFQSTLLMRGATLRQHLRRQENHISIHAPHARSDRCGGDCIDMQRLISIHAPHARSDLAAMQSCHPDWISIHAPHARSDVKGQGYHQLVEYFNPRSSCEERRSSSSKASTSGNFNPRSSCEERQWRSRPGKMRRNFNPRSSCEERHIASALLPVFIPFQSTLLMRGATAVRYSRLLCRDISIHAPHARSDCALLHEQSSVPNFNPRSSCEERPKRAYDELSAI